MMLRKGMKLLCANSLCCVQKCCCDKQLHRVRCLSFLMTNQQTVSSGYHGCMNTTQMSSWHMNLLKAKFNSFLHLQRHATQSKGEEILSMKNRRLRSYLDCMLNEYKSKKNSNYSSQQMELLNLIQLFQQSEQEVEELQRLKSETEDKEMVEMINEEFEKTKDILKEYEANIISLLHDTETDKVIDRDLILEAHQGVGGQEAMLFAGEIFEMYKRCAVRNGWQFDVITYDDTDTGGVRQATAQVSGPGAYRKLCYEAGIHRVQRVPKTERSGRIHTSTMSLAVLPQPTKIEVDINPKDVKMDTFRAGGAGGQHVNKIESAVRLTHIPTGTIVECQEDRSQHKNRAMALKLLRSRLYNAQLKEQTKNYSSSRKLQAILRAYMNSNCRVLHADFSHLMYHVVQIGTGARADKVRTYNFSQDRITDHRIQRTIHGVDSFMNAGENMEELLQDLYEFSRKEQLLEKLNDFVEPSHVSGS